MVIEPFWIVAFPEPKVPVVKSSVPATRVVPGPVSTLPLMVPSTIRRPSETLKVCSKSRPTAIEPPYAIRVYGGGLGGDSRDPLIEVAGDQKSDVVHDREGAADLGRAEVFDVEVPVVDRPDHLKRPAVDEVAVPPVPGVDQVVQQPGAIVEDRVVVESEDRILDFHFAEILDDTVRQGRMAPRRCHPRRG